MKTAITTLCAAFAALAVSAKTSTPDGWLDDYDAALNKAAKENKHVIVDFSGSDWCGWCKRLEVEVFDTDAFRKAAAEKYVLLMVDSPRDVSLLTPAAALNNPKLVEKFGVRGFPTVVVLNSKGEEVLRTGYKEGGPEKYIKMLDEEISFGPEIQQYIKPIMDVLDSCDSEMDKAADGVLAKVTANLPKPGKKSTVGERRKYKEQIQAEVRRVLFEEVFPAYLPKMEEALSKAKAMNVPEVLEDRKKELIEGYTAHYNELKQVIKQYKDADK